MRSIWTRVAAFGVAGVIALGTIASASAATRHKRQAAPAEQDQQVQQVQQVQQDQMIGSDVQLAPRNNWQPVPPASWQGPYGCVTDEGYGRYDACDVGGAS